MGGSQKWMGYKGKSHQNGWFRGIRILGNPHVMDLWWDQYQQRVYPIDNMKKVENNHIL